MNIQVRFNAGIHFIDLKRLGNVIDASQGKSLDLIHNFGRCADKDDRDFLQISGRP